METYRHCRGGWSRNARDDTRNGWAEHQYEGSVYFVSFELTLNSAFASSVPFLIFVAHPSRTSFLFCSFVVVTFDTLFLVLFHPKFLWRCHHLWHCHFYLTSIFLYRPFNMSFSHCFHFSIPFPCRWHFSHIFISSKNVKLTSQIDIKIWQRSQSKKKGKKRNLVAATSLSLIELSKRHFSDASTFPHPPSETALSCYLYMIRNRATLELSAVSEKMYF
jgi:hypothetical protein